MQLVFSDIHGDKKAAKSIDQICNGFEEVLCCGDICGYGQDFKYVIDMLKSNGVKCVLGNHDYMVIHEEMDLSDIIPCVADPIKWTRRNIKNKEKEFLLSLPTQLETDSGIFIRHTIGLDHYVRTEDDCLGFISMTSKRTICFGHTHKFEEYKVDGRTIVNVGSASKGRQGTNPCCVMIDKGRVIYRELGG